MTELHRKNQYDWTADEYKQIFEFRQPAFIFIANEGGADGYNYIQCKYCGAIFRHTAQNMRPSRKRVLTCNNCERIERQHKKQIQEEVNAALKGKSIIHNRNRGKQLSMAECSVCRQLFVKTGQRKYCSTSCASYLHWKGKEQYRYKIALDVLYQRDKGICHICGRLCDWNDYTILEDGSFKVGANYPTRDHLIPKSKGGEHSYQNIKLAHHQCNSLRGAGADAPR